MPYLSSPALSALGAFALAAALASPVSAQTTANVTVDASSPLATVPASAFGVNAACWDGDMLDASVPTLLKQAGISALRFPGGSTSDVYEWSTNTGTSGSNQYTNPNCTFDAFMSVAQQTGASPIITVNYGSNDAGTAGGDPNDAAAWVDYANNTKKYGVKYWEIGNEVYGNGEYDGVQWETDLHNDHSPTTYGSNVVQFAAAMKAKDPTIKVGAVLAAPGAWPDGQSPDWNSGVLSQCGTSIDFVIIHWYPQGPGGESDSGLLGSTSQIAGMVSATRALINQYCGSNAPNVQILVTETNSVSSNPGKQSVSTVNTLFIADNYMSWLENGVANVDLWDMHNGTSTSGNNSSSLFGSADYGDYGLLSSGGGGEPAQDSPMASYYGLQMLTYLGSAGDATVSTSSSVALIASHAVMQADGKLAVLLINKDPNNSCTTSINLNGFTPTGSGTLYSYGPTSGSITTSTLSVGQSFSITLPSYSMVTAVMSPVSAVSPTFLGTATTTPAAGKTVQISFTLTDTGAAVSKAVVQIETDDSAGNEVDKASRSGQSFTSGSANSYKITWKTPSTPGTYHVKLTVFSFQRKSTYYVNADAASFTVGSPDSSQYNFESGLQGWTDSSGIISGVAVSGAESFVGTESLAVNFNGTGSGAQQAYAGSPSTPAGATVTFHVWIPAGSAISAIQPYVQQGSGGGWAWTGSYQAISSLKTDAWNTISVVVPPNSATPLYQLGVQFFTNGAWNGTCYVDSVGW